MSEVKKRSVTIAGHRTSVSLETEFWDEITRIASEQGISLNRLIAEIDRTREANLSSAIRLYVLAHIKRAAATRPEEN